MPHGEQERKMRQFAGSARYVFNRALAMQNQEREATGRKRSGYAALCRMLTAWRNHPEPEGFVAFPSTPHSRHCEISKGRGRGISRA